MRLIFQFIYVQYCNSGVRTLTGRKRSTSTKAVNIEQFRTCCVFLHPVDQGNSGLTDLKQTSCDVGFRFGKFRDYSTKIGNYETFRCTLENTGCIPLAVVMMTTANGIHPKFCDGIGFFLIFSDLYRVIKECIPTPHEMFLNQLDPCYPKMEHLLNRSKFSFSHRLFKNIWNFVSLYQK